LPVPLYGCGICILSLRARARLFEKRLPRKIPGPNRKWQKDGEKNVVSGGMEDKKYRQGFDQEICKTRGQLKDPMQTRVLCKE
jgi:hypothetical protein